MSKNVVPKIPKNTKADVGHLAVRALIASAPYLGGAALEIFNAVIAPPLLKRRDKWLEDLAKVINELKEEIEGLSYEKLRDNEEFVSIVIYATTIAIKTHQEEKTEALKNAIKSSITKESISYDVKIKFLSLIDSLTITHVKLLVFFDNPTKHFSNEEGTMIGGGDIGSIVETLRKGFPEFNENLQATFIGDLENYGLIKEIPLYIMMTGSGTLESRITELGKSFLEFIRIE